MIELTAAIFVLAMGTFGTIQIYNVGTAKAAVVNEAAIAASALGNELETLRALPFDELDARAGQPFLSTTPLLKNLPEVSTHVAVHDDEPGRADLKQVTVTVRWSGEHGRVIEKGLTTLIADKGIE